MSGCKPIVLLLLAVVLGGCVTGGVRPASIAKGECEVFREAVANGKVFYPAGVNTRDKRWIAQNYEAGIAACGWRRPPAEVERKIKDGTYRGRIPTS